MSGPRRAPFARRAPFGAAAPLAALMLAAGCAGPWGGCSETDYQCRAEWNADGYRKLERWYREDGMMRTERAPEDAPIDAKMLALNFEVVAFNSEYAPGEKLDDTRTPAPLTRWTGPLRWRVEGDGATEADREEMRRLTARVAALTGLEAPEADPRAPGFGATGDNIEEGLEPPRITLFVLGPLGRDMVRRQIEKQTHSSPVVRAWTQRPEYPCVGVILQRGGRGDEDGPRAALIFIKSELEGLFRQSCLHEEFVQALGLTNDGHEVRPSIFNDDQEFALLTEHDELLLRILYDERLRPGMTAEEGMPIVRRIAAELMAERDGR